MAMIDFSKILSQIFSFINQEKEEGPVAVAPLVPRPATPPQDTFEGAEESFQRRGFLRDAFAQSTTPDSMTQHFGSPWMYSPWGLLTSLAGCDMLWNHLVDEHAREQHCNSVPVEISNNRLYYCDTLGFHRDSQYLLSSSSEALDHMAQFLNDHPAIRRIEIQGRSGNTGEVEMNLHLSQRRADAVRAELIRRGVAPERLVSTGYGYEPGDFRFIEYLILDSQPETE